MLPWILGFIIAFGLLVVVPVVAIITENRRKTPHASGDFSEAVRNFAELQATVQRQQKEIDELRDLLHVNILKFEEERDLRHRLGE